MTAVDEIKARLEIVDIVSETVKLRRSGRSYTGFCPFHPNAKTPAFAVFPESGTWRCFGQCNEGGDIFKYMMKREGWDFAEALRRLAERAGVTLETFTPERKAAEDEYERLRELLEEAVNFYQFQLLKTPAGQPALDFLTRRGVKPETIQAFGLGYSPSGYDGMVNHFSAKGFSTDDLLAVGLVVPRESGGVYDKYRNRVMFPIRDAAGKMAGFGARILDPNDIPKFLNSPQTVLFDKSHLLYGLNFARKPIRAQDQVVIVEGYLDAIILHQAGFDNTVSPMGTALNEDQFRLLKKFTKRIVLALDADAAGEKATLRGLDLARNALDHETELTFDAHGLLRHEARLQADVRVTTIPDGMDPDEVVLRDPEEWRTILSAA
ncbi:MAG: DNA primase, partial [Anaerolineaceae bacterium]|nr:DNA primase [Anaerolineaceae bacterium]